MAGKSENRSEANEQAVESESCVYYVNFRLLHGFVIDGYIEKLCNTVQKRWNSYFG